MEILEVTFDEFSAIFPEPFHVFGSGAFAELNAHKAEKVFCLVFKDSKYRLGLTVGLKDNGLFSPFSAPHGGFVFFKEDVKIQYIDEAVQALVEWCKNKQMSFISFTLPPTIYDAEFVSKQANSLFRHGFFIKNIELNHSFSLCKFYADYLSNIWYNARKNLKIAQANNLTFTKCETMEEKVRAYSIIESNRKQRGFPLNMTLEEVQKTVKLIASEVFLVYNDLNTPIASAIVFHVAKEMVQVLYWGDLPEHNKLKTMNFLSYHVFEYYKNTEIKIVDIGQSTVFSVPNPGLCDFKESIGCDISQKMTFRMDLN